MKPRWLSAVLSYRVAFGGSISTAGGPVAAKGGSAGSTKSASSPGPSGSTESAAGDATGPSSGRRGRPPDQSRLRKDRIERKAAILDVLHNGEGPSAAWLLGLAVPTRIERDAIWRSPGNSLEPCSSLSTGRRHALATGGSALTLRVVAADNLGGPYIEDRSGVRIPVSLDRHGS